MISKTLKVSLFVIALCSVTFINAQDGKRKKRQNPDELFKTLDTNTDGELSLEEFTSKRQREEIKAEVMADRFKTFDTNSNGSLSLEEFKSRREVSKEKRIEKRFSEMDSNGDGTVDLTEYKAFLEEAKTHRKKREHRRHKRDR